MSYNYNFFTYNGKPAGNTYYDIADFYWKNASGVYFNYWASISSVNLKTSNNIITTSSAENCLIFTNPGIYELLFSFSFLNQDIDIQEGPVELGYQMFRLNKYTLPSSSVAESPYYYNADAFGSCNTTTNTYSTPTSTYPLYRTPTVTCSDTNSSLIYAIYYNTSNQISTESNMFYPNINYFRAVINVPTSNYTIYPQLISYKDLTGYDSNGYLYGTTWGAYIKNGTARVMVRLISNSESEPT